MLYNRTLLFIHSVYNSLHLLISNSHSISPSPFSPLGNHKPVLYVCVDSAFLTKHWLIPRWLWLFFLDSAICKPLSEHSSGWTAISLADTGSYLALKLHLGLRRNAACSDNVVCFTWLWWHWVKESWDLCLWLEPQTISPMKQGIVSVLVTTGFPGPSAAWPKGGS